MPASPESRSALSGASRGRGAGRDMVAVPELPVVDLADISRAVILHTDTVTKTIRGLLEGKSKSHFRDGLEGLMTRACHCDQPHACG